MAASQSTRAFEDGHALLRAADSEDEVEWFSFVMYVSGVAAGARDVIVWWNASLRNKPEFALPEILCVPTKITYRDLADAVRIWLRGHPELQTLPSAFLIIEALVEQFPCK